MTKFHVYVSTHKGPEVALGAIDSNSAGVAARLAARRVHVPSPALEGLIRNALRTPLVHHKEGTATVWAVPTVG